MIKLLGDAIRQLQQLPEDIQDVAACLVFRLEEEAERGERAAIAEGRKEFERGEFMTLEDWRHDMECGDH